MSSVQAKQLHWKFIHDPNRHQEEGLPIARRVADLAESLGVDSVSILFNHRSFQKLAAFFFRFPEVFWKEGSLERMGKVPMENQYESEPSKLWSKSDESERRSPSPGE